MIRYQNKWSQRIASHVHHGFTLIELMIVVAVIVVLIAILVPAMGHFRNHAIKSTAVAQLNALSTALGQYFSDFNVYPPSNYLPTAPPAPNNADWPQVGRGPALLAQALMGYLPFDRDGAGPKLANGNPTPPPNQSDPTFGFRIRASSMGGKIYGPYASDDPKNYKQNQPGKDEVFIDPWGNEILYFRSTRATGSTASGLPVAPPKIFLDQSNGDTDGYFTPDDCKITFNGTAMNGTNLSVVPPPPVSPNPRTSQQNSLSAFYLLISSVDTNIPAASTLGSNSFLLISAGEDGIYFTADDIVVSKQ